MSATPPGTGEKETKKTEKTGRADDGKPAGRGNYLKSKRRDERLPKSQGRDGGGVLVREGGRRGKHARSLVLGRC